MSNSTESCILPTALEQYLFDTLDADYKPGGNVDINLYNQRAENRRYLGTYLPRSVVESRTIFSELFTITAVREHIRSVERLRILDVGCGTGGTLIGFIEALSNAPIWPKSIEVWSIDGNEDALQLQEAIFKDVMSDRINCNYNRTPIMAQFDPEQSLYTYLTNTVAEHSIPGCDIILTAKFISELYNVSPSKSDFFTEFLQFSEAMLNPEGLLYMLDVVSRKFGQPAARDYTTRIMAAEIRRYLNQKSTLTPALPVACGRWNQHCVGGNSCYTQRNFRIRHRKCNNDHSQICYRIMTHPSTAQKILQATAGKPGPLLVNENRTEITPYCNKGRRCSLPVAVLTSGEFSPTQGGS